MTRTLVILLLSACMHEPAQADPGPKFDAEAKARGVLQHQIDVAKTDDKALEATFTSDAVILHHGYSSAARRMSMWGLGESGPDGAPSTKAKITKLLAGGTADAVWFYAEVTLTPPRGAPAVTQVIELLDGADQWHVVAASFGQPETLQVSDSNLEIPNATGRDGALTKLIGSTSAIGAALDPDAIVVGPAAGQLARGAKAKDALASWKLDPIQLYLRAREIHKATWGFVQTYYDHPEASPSDVDRGIAQAFAVSKPDGTWSVVLVQYRAR